MALHPEALDQGVTAAAPVQRGAWASIDALVAAAAPIYAGLIAPWVTLVHTDGGRAKSVELLTSAIAQAQALYAVAGGLPVNVTAPVVSQTGPQQLGCTTGTWTGAPTGYAYQWVRDGTTPVGTNAAAYRTMPPDVGHVITCVVTATNAAGTSVAPPSNGVPVSSLAEAARIAAQREVA